MLKIWTQCDIVVVVVSAQASQQDHRFNSWSDHVQGVFCELA